MIKQLLKLSIVFSFLFLMQSGYSQTNNYKVRKCFGYQRDSCPSSQNIFYKIHPESRSALFLKGQRSKTKLMIYNGRDYRISLCWDPVLGSQIQLRILNPETEGVLYDNATDEFSSEFEFTVTETIEIEIEIIIDGSSAMKQANSGDDDFIIVRKDQTMGCVGVLIEHMITPTKGF